jgi:cytochrome c-type biogenesis protein CcsB
MRVLCSILVSSLALAALVGADTQPSGDFDWSRWRDLPVQDGGRRKPLDTLARELLRATANRSTYPHPETDEKLEPTAWYLSLLFDWQGLKDRRAERLLRMNKWHEQYASLQQPDKWDQAPLLRVDLLDLRALFGMESDEAHVAPAYLNTAAIEEPTTAQKVPFVVWGGRLQEREENGETLSNLEKEAAELVDHLWSYQNLRMGRGLEILPVKGSDKQEWMPVGQLLLSRLDDSTDPTGAYRQVRQLVETARTAFHAHDVGVFNQCADDLKTALRELGGADYPSASLMQLEVSYNRWVPFRFAWCFTLSAAVAMLLHLAAGWRAWLFATWSAYLLGLAALAVGLSMRIAISGRPPVTNMYESVIYVGLGVALLGLVFELVYRRKYLLAAAAAMSTLALVLADNCSLILDARIRPLEPVLRSNFWLVTHVMTVALSYAAFALASAIANITLGHFLAGSTNRSAIDALGQFTYKAIQVGVLLLAAGIILGGVWADYSWGRFWGWDPKEVWALVALLGYLALLHARFAGWIGQRGLAAGTAGCFSLVIMAWYGVNFVLGAGLHSYGFGGGGQGAIGLALLAQLAYAGLALWRSRQVNPAAASAAIRAELPPVVVNQAG